MDALALVAAYARSSDKGTRLAAAATLDRLLDEREDAARA